MKARKVGFWLVAAPAALAWTGPALAQVEIEYWQYTFAQRVQAIDELIKRFKAANPGIKVKHMHVPYDDFRVKIAAAIPAGHGPDVVQLFYGWLRAAPRVRAEPRADRRSGPLPRGNEYTVLLTSTEAVFAPRARTRAGAPAPESVRMRWWARIPRGLLELLPSKFLA